MINRLNEILVSKGDKFVDNFLDNDVTIAEKLDTHRVQFFYYLLYAWMHVSGN